MINGSAIFSCPVSTVTINVAKEATDKDHQRLRADDEEVAFDEVILAAVQGSRFKVVRDVAHPILEIEP
jgi:hypothetical protein